MKSLSLLQVRLLSSYTGSGRWHSEEEDEEEEERTTRTTRRTTRGRTRRRRRWSNEESEKSSTNLLLRWQVATGCRLASQREIANNSRSPALTHTYKHIYTQAYTHVNAHIFTSSLAPDQRQKKKSIHLKPTLWSRHKMWSVSGFSFLYSLCESGCHWVTSPLPRCLRGLTVCHQCSYLNAEFVTRRKWSRNFETSSALAGISTANIWVNNSAC